MFEFIKKFVVTMSFFSGNALNAISLKCFSMNNRECRIRPEILNIDSNEPMFYPFNIEINKCSGSCHNINYPFVKLYVSDVVKNMNLKVFNLMSKTNETRHAKWHETWKRECN